MSSYAIPEYFLEAAGIFVNELEEHIEFFDKLLDEFERSPQCVLDQAKETAERFHLIRGGAGFLGMAPIQECATAGERYFRDQLTTDSQRAGSELKNLLTVLHRELAGVREAVGK